MKIFLYSSSNNKQLTIILFLYIIVIIFSNTKQQPTDANTSTTSATTISSNSSNINENENILSVEDDILIETDFNKKETIVNNNNINVDTYQPYLLNEPYYNQYNTIHHEVDQLLIKNHVNKCVGKCTAIPLDFPQLSSLNQPHSVWTSSHGSPSVGNKYVWMWSGYNVGEGVNLSYKFEKGKKYCIETVADASVRGMSNAHPSSKVNLILTKTTVNGIVTSSGGAPIPSINKTETQQLWGNSYSELQYTVNNPYPLYVHNFISNNDYNNIWYYPYSSNAPIVELSLREVNICEKHGDPCDFNLKVYVKKKCQLINLYPATSFSSNSSLKVQGYTWNFGDSNYSNNQSPSHLYELNNKTEDSYKVSLSLLVVNSDSKYCIKNYWFTVKVNKCTNCELLQLVNINLSNNGYLNIFEPNVKYNPFYIYKWEFSDGSSYNKRVIYKSISLYWVKLHIWYIGNEKEHCKQEVYREIYIIDNIKKDSRQVALRLNDIFEFYNNESNEYIKNYILTASKQEGLDYYQELEQVILNKYND